MTVKLAVRMVVDAKDSAGNRLSRDEYRQFLEDLLAEAEGWRMELEEDE